MKFLRGILLLELRRLLSRATVVLCGNISVQYISNNHVHHQKTKHIKIDLYFIRDKIALGEIKVLHVPSSLHYADIFTKGLPSSLFFDFRHSLPVGDCLG
jgi:hypothetical protein